MKSNPRDVLIHYDQERGVVIFHSIPVEHTDKIRAGSFGGVRLPVDYCRSLSSNEAEMELGRVVFSLIDLNSEKKIGIRDYAEEAATAHGLWVQDLEVRAKGGDQEAQHALFIELHSVALKNYSMPDLLRAEGLLMAAAAQGDGMAQHSLEAWPVVKAAAERRICRGKSP